MHSSIKILQMVSLPAEGPVVSSYYNLNCITRIFL